MKLSRVVFTTLAVVAAAATSTRAHFIFILPPADPQPARLVLSDTPAVDPKATAEGLAIKNVTIYRADGQKAELKAVLDKMAGVWTLPAGEKLDSVIVTSVDYGVVNRGEGERYLIRYHAKLVTDLARMPKDQPALPLDIAPRRKDQGVAFLVTVGGKPQASLDVIVHEPGQTKIKVVKTDLDGFTPTFTTAGEYAVRAAYTDPAAGEFEGRRFRNTQHYSTLVLVLPGQ